MKSLIEKLEAAQTVQGAVEAFQLVAEEIPVSEDFLVFVSQAASTSLKKADRAWGYLLLAALTLVPKGWRLYTLQESKTRIDVAKDKWFAGIDKHGPGVSGEYASTPAIALCIAALKAREAETSG